jgi:hypothetical protein
MKLLPGHELVALLVAVCFAAGLNVYATVGTLGLLSHTGILTLPSSLSLLSSWWVIGVSAVLFSVEFFADKIPGFDLIWNAAHTFIRVPVAGLLAYQATTGLSPLEQMGTTLAGGAIAFAANGGKMAMRTAATASPEPFSNMALSMGEDTLAVALTWFATKHPYLGAAIAAVLLTATILMIRMIIREIRDLFRGAERAFKQVFG